MKTLVRLLLVCWWMLPAAHAAASTRMSLVLSRSIAKPGETVMAALRMNSEQGWHTYWRNPGDAGVAPSIAWEVPGTVTVAPIQWPVPEKMVISKLYAYVYEKETLLLFPVTISAEAKPGRVLLKGAVDWLECSEKTCVPQSGNVQATLEIGTDSKSSEYAPLIEQWRGRLPEKNANLKVDARWERVDDSTRKLFLEWNPGAAPTSPDFFPYEDAPAIGAETTVVEASSNAVKIEKTVKSGDGTWSGTVQGIILNDTAGPNHHAIEVSFSVPPLPGDKPAAATTVGSAPVQLGASSGPGSLLAILGLAFLGGLILNVMPCVLPVIALKILGFVNQSREDPKRVRELGIVYMLGVLASFLVLAGGLLAARQAAGDVNWGMQMQNPYFVVGMLVLVTLVALNLWGVFEITLPGQALGAAGELASREGRSGAFYNGVLATLLATPCTAPALGAAVGAVLTKPSYIVVITFLMIGFGLALPYVILSWNPRLMKFLPKPGAWMEKFKIAMGFPMAATAIWLWSFGGTHFGDSGGLWLGLFLVFVALAAWIYGDFVQRGTSHRGFAMGLAVAILVLGYAFTLESSLHWREPRPVATSDDEIVTEPGGIRWKRWNTDAIQKARAEGHPVMIDFTAAWCFTCQLNKRTSIEVEGVKQKLKEIDAVPFLADFTHRDPKIGAAIRSYGRAGIPLVVVLPADPTKAPILLPEGPFTEGTLLEALSLGAGSKVQASAK